MCCLVPRFWFALLALAVLISDASPADAQNPGNSDPSLDALVGNSKKISVVRVRSFALDDKMQDLVSAEFEVLDLLKRPARVLPKQKPRKGGGGPAPDPVQEVDKKQTISMSAAALKRLRRYESLYWGLDFSKPIQSSIDFVPPWHEKQTELLLFHGFQSVEKEPYDFLVPLTDKPILLADWTTVASKDAILKKTSELVDRYRGVKQLDVALIDPSHFAGPLTAQGEKLDDAFKERLRGFLVPTDANYEKLLIAQVQYPNYLYAQNNTYYASVWREYANALSVYDSEKNHALFRKLVADPEIAEVQKNTLLNILADWESNR